jgi:hypothetical protein
MKIYKREINHLDFNNLHKLSYELWNNLMLLRFDYSKWLFLNLINSNKYENIYRS